MSESLERIREKLSALAGKWTGYAALGSFLLYLFGYLVLRFQLSVYGVATGIDIFDEKYLFAGCRFFVYLISTVPSVLILCMLLAAIGYLPYMVLPAGIKGEIRNRLGQLCVGPIRLLFFGVFFAVVFIQFVLRQCFAFVGNLLLVKSIPDIWITKVLLSGDGRIALYMSGLVAGTILTGAILFYAWWRFQEETTVTRSLKWLLGFLFVVEVLFLPVNYGILVSTQWAPRVAEVSGETSTPNDRMIWLLWDGKDTFTYMVRDRDDRRMLVTVPAKEARIRILAYDSIISTLFAERKTE